MIITYKTWKLVMVLNKLNFLLNYLDQALESFHEVWNRIIIVYLINFSIDSTCTCHLFILKFKSLIFGLKVMWDKSKHKAEQLTQNQFFQKYSFQIISGGKFSVNFSKGHFLFTEKWALRVKMKIKFCDF